MPRRTRGGGRSGSRGGGAGAGKVSAATSSRCAPRDCRRRRSNASTGFRAKPPAAGSTAPLTVDCYPTTTLANHRLASPPIAATFLHAFTRTPNHEQSMGGRGGRRNGSMQQQQQQQQMMGQDPNGAWFGGPGMGMQGGYMPGMMQGGYMQGVMPGGMQGGDGMSGAMGPMNGGGYPGMMMMPPNPNSPGMPRSGAPDGGKEPPMGADGGMGLMAPMGGESRSRCEMLEARRSLPATLACPSHSTHPARAPAAAATAAASSHTSLPFAPSSPSPHLRSLVAMPMSAGGPGQYPGMMGGFNGMAMMMNGAG